MGGRITLEYAPEAFDPGQIFDVQHDRELPSRCGVSNLTKPRQHLNRQPNGAHPVRLASFHQQHRAIRPDSAPS